jgi:hypothetical protein
MKRYLLLFTFFIFGFSENDVQSEFIVINWNKFSSEGQAGNKMFQYTFDEAAYYPGNSGVPYFSRLYNQSGFQSGFQFTIENPVFEAVEDSFDLNVLNNIPGEIRVETQVLKSGNTLKTELKILPLKMEDGKLFRLKSFNLKKTPVQNKSAVISTHEWKSQSVLNSGKWVKIKTTGKGIYKIPYSTLSEWGFSDPSKVNVFGSGGTQLSEEPGEINYDDLEQNAVWYDENNGENCLFFYEPGNITWSVNNEGKYFEHKVHDYSNNGFFFLTEDAGSAKTVQTATKITEAPTHQVTDFVAYTLYEKNALNLISSGKQWFGERFSHNQSHSFSFNLPGINNSKDVYIKINAAARSYQSSKMKIKTNSVSSGEFSFSNVYTEEPADLYASEANKSILYNAESEDLKIDLTYVGSNANAIGWLDYIEINYSRKLNLNEGALFFRDLESVGTGNVADFEIGPASSSVRVFDVTDVNNVLEIPEETSGDRLKIRRPSETLKEYVAFNPNGDFPEPGLVGDVENQNLHGLPTPEFLIITHPSFLNAANELAEFHESYDGLNTEVVASAKVYNEFSSGHFDATGIRNFIKMFYDRGNTLKYVLLFGDGSFDNKNVNSGDFNFIPTYQSQNSLNPVGSFITDDYYALLDEGESVYSGAVDLGIGRIPASTPYQAQTVVDKIKNYHTPQALGNWRNIICFIGDDEDGNIHMSDSEKLANLINGNHKEFVTDKIYFDAFTQKTTTSGEEYPEVTEAINKRVQDGVLVLNYVGHANHRFLANEHVLDIGDINSWSNTNTLPIFVTATCEFSRFDAEETSAGEYVLFNANGGGIGLFSTTRLVNSSPNYLLSRSFYSYVFQSDGDGEHYRMGDVMRLAKINTSNSINKRSFSLLADPALKISFPEYKVVTTTINGQDATSGTDTIGALQKITVSGYISDNDGDKLENFSGEIIPTVYDKAIRMETLGNAGETPMEFKVQENVIYKGVASVTNGSFSFSFVVPKDISYTLGNGKIIYYADNGETDAHGAFENFVIGGTDNQITDNQGPDIQLYMDSEDFQSGDKTGNSPTLLAFLSDENGINTAGTGIGHDITAVLDNDYSNVFVLNKYYQSNPDDYTGGLIQFPFTNLSPGMHTLKLKAWDVANNSSEVEIGFLVSGEFIISGVSTYPNPMNNYTYFVFEHNQPGAVLETLIEVFDILGRRIDYFQTEVGSNGTASNPIRWDLNELMLEARDGIYFYRVTAQNEDGIITSKSGKLVISN